MGRDLGDVARFTAATTGLATLATYRDDGSAQLTLVNAGLVTHPVTGARVAALVALGGARKLANLRETPTASLLWRHEWDWLTVEGTVELAGPDDPLEGLEPSGLPQLLRDVFTGAGGTHDDWPEFDRVMAQERRCAVLVSATRVYGNPGS